MSVFYDKNYVFGDLIMMTSTEKKISCTKMYNFNIKEMDQFHLDFFK